MLISLEENKSYSWKKYNVMAWKDAWLQIARIQTDSEWFINWLQEQMKINPPKEM